MPPLDQTDPATPGGPLTSETLIESWLLGQPSLDDYLHFVARSAIDGETADRRALCDEWRAANDHYHELETDDAGAANDAIPKPLPPAMRPLATALRRHENFKRTYDDLPVRIGLVELDRLVAFQLHVTQSFVDRIAASLGPDPDPAALFRFCLPIDRKPPAAEIRKVGSRRFAFLSDSTDLRFHDPVVLTPEQRAGYASFGPVAGVVGLVVGFGVNCLSVIEADGRLLLQNGYHRACALRSLGITHVPCVIKTVTRLDELALTAAPRVVDAPALYFRARRPPMLKDFFDPRIRKLLPVKRQRKMIEVSFEVREFDVAEPHFGA